MPTTVSVDVYAKDRASSTFDKVGNSAHRSGGLVGKFGTTVAGVFTGAALYNGARDLVHVLGEMGESAAQDETAARRMALQFHNSAHATKAQVAATEDWITAQGKALGIADDDLRPALTRAVTSTGDVAKAQSLVSLAMDISASKGKSLQSVTEALSKAQNGNISGLSKMGVAVKDADGKTRSLSDITKELTKTYSGQAAAAAGTTAGQYARLKVQISETGEAIGYKLLPYAVEFGEWALNDGLPRLQELGGYLQDELGPTVNDMKHWFSENKDELKDFAKVVGEDVVGGLRVVIDVGGKVVGFFNGLPGPVKEAGIEVAIGAAAFRELNSAVAAVKMSSFIQNVGTAEGRTKALGGAVRSLSGAGGLAALVDGVHRSNGALSALEEVGGGAALGFSMGGPWGALIGGAGGGLIAAFRHLKNGTDDASDSMRDAKPNFDALADSIANMDESSRRAVKSSILLKLQQDGIVTSATQLGIATSDLIKASLGNDKAIGRVNDAWSKQGDLLEGLTNQKVSDWIYGLRTATMKSEEATRKNNAALDGTDRSASKANTALASVGKVKPQTDRWSALLIGDLNQGVHDTGDRVDSMRTLLSTGVGKARANMGPFKGDLMSQLGAVGVGGHTAGIGVGHQIQSGVMAGLSGLGGAVFGAVEQAIQNGINAAHAHGGAGGGGGGGNKGGSTTTPRTTGRGGVVDGNYFGLGNNTLAHSGAALLASLVAGITSGKVPLDKVLDKVKADVQNKLDFRANLQAMRDQLAGGFAGLQESVFSTQGTEDAPVTLEQLLAKSAAERAKAASVDTDVQKLLSMGISKDLIEQFQSQGSAGVDALHALAGASADQLAQIMGDNAAAQASYAHAGQVSADKFYATQIAAADQQLAIAQSVQSALTQLQAWGEKLRFELQGDTLVAALAKEKKDKGKQ